MLQCFPCRYDEATKAVQFIVQMDKEEEDTKEEIGFSELLVCVEVDPDQGQLLKLERCNGNLRQKWQWWTPGR